MDNQSANSEFGLNHYLDQEKSTNSLTVDSGIGNRHSISEHSTDYPMANSGFDLNHNSEDLDIDNSVASIDCTVASNGIAGIQTQKANTRYLDQKPLMINVLTQGKELLNQLRIHLNPSSSTGEFLIETMLSSFNKTLSILNSSVSETEIQPIRTISGKLESPCSINGDPQSDDLNRRDMYKKRVMLPQWTEQVRVCSGPGLEGPLEDGYSWRKYGQKEVLGAKYPRSYYRCTHKRTQGCLATKQAQRSEDDPSFFEVTYQGKHTCMPPSGLAQGLPPPDKQKQNPNQQEQQRQKQSQENSPTSYLDFSLDPMELDRNLPFDSLIMFDKINNPISIPSSSWFSTTR